MAALPPPGYSGAASAPGRATLAVCVACGGGLVWYGQVDGIARCGPGGRRPSRRAR